MSAEEAEKTTTTTTAAAEAPAGDEEEEWLYGDEGETKETEEEEAKLNAAVSAPSAPAAPEENSTGNGVASQEEAQGDNEDSESDSDDDDDDVRVTIGDIKTGAPQYTSYGAAPVNLNIKTGGSRPYGAVGAKVKGVDLDAPGSINGGPVLEVDMESFEEKPWRKPGADLSDYFNYGFNEETWKAYCEKQKRLRMGLDNINISSATSKISVQQGRTGNDKEAALPAHVAKTDFTSPSNLYKTGLNPARISPPQWAGPASQDTPYYTKSTGTIDVIGGQTATISRVEGRRRHNLEGNNIQVISEHTTSEAEATPAKIPAFFPPGPLPPNMPPPPFLPPPPVSQAPPLIPPPRLPITVPPPGFPPPPTGPPPSLMPTLDNGHPGGYDCRPVTPYPFPPGGYPPPMQGPVNNWAGMMDNSKQWDYYPRREKEREKERERERTRDRGHDREREREREHSPSSMAYNSSLSLTHSDEERYRYRDYGDRGYERHRERSSREKEERHRERRHREKEEGRHKSSRSSSRRRHDSEEGDGHRRHKHKKSKRSKEGKEPSEERAADQENQEAME
ncbi:pre-mRNA 3'-end-processing factor FIP1 isoform X3 [Pangasianodon hypophthalmus]|uniref:pre-mRNA 3'-end-processing factor FIP1 isoform X3 n=1 Tax=Pangasianodon hypophthalmus TaxID=310915 RepID=UPI000EFDDBC4|nr:pre-mRNA 3'-end-processing factor FIP1 isoform X3 [Pangasianodon hypophthalmus]